MTYLNLLVMQIGPMCVLIILNCMIYKELKRSMASQNHSNLITASLCTENNGNGICHSVVTRGHSIHGKQFSTFICLIQLEHLRL